MDDKFSWCVTHFCDDFTVEHYTWYKDYRDGLLDFLRLESDQLSLDKVKKITKEIYRISNLMMERISIMY